MEKIEEYCRNFQDGLITGEECIMSIVSVFEAAHNEDEIMAMLANRILKQEDSQ